MAKFRAIVNAVRQAITGNATTADVLNGKTFMSAASPNEQTGAMTNNGAVTASLTADGQVYTIPAGYHNGAGTVTANIQHSDVVGAILCDSVFSTTTYSFYDGLENIIYNNVISQNTQNFEFSVGGQHNTITLKNKTDKTVYAYFYQTGQNRAILAGATESIQTATQSALTSGLLSFTQIGTPA